MKHLLSALDLDIKRLDPHLRIIDTRFVLTDPAAGRKAYQQAHIPNAVYFDLDEDLSQKPSQHGGRHPLPDMERFAQTLGERGMDNSSHVVIYDDSGGMFAARLWWMLRYAGHERVQLLDGGIDAWQAAGLPLSSEVPDFEASHFELKLRPEMVVDADYVLRNLDNPDILLLDARSSDRYRGENETMDPKAGHIPGALSLPFADNLKDKSFKTTTELVSRFDAYDLQEAEEIIAYCGSGVSATHNILALEEAGIKNVKLYAGSWSDWVSYDDYPIATDDEP